MALKLQLPGNVLMTIFSSLDSRSLLHCRCVCSNWKKTMEKETEILLRLLLSNLTQSLSEYYLDKNNPSLLEDTLCSMLFTVKLAPANHLTVGRYAVFLQ